MNKEEAQTVLDHELERYKTMSYEELVRTIEDGPYTKEHVGATDDKYLIEIKTRWKKRKKGIVRISAYIRNAEVSPQERRTWKIPILNIAFCRASMSGIFTTFTRGPDD